MGPLPSPRIEPHQHCTKHLSVPEKQSLACRNVQSLCWSTLKSYDQLICPLHVPLSPAVEQLLNTTWWALCPWRGKITSSKCSPGRGNFSPCDPGFPIPKPLDEPYTPLSLPPCLAPQKVFPPLCSTKAFLSPNSHLWIFHLPHSFHPIMQIVFLILRPIS